MAKKADTIHVRVRANLPPGTGARMDGQRDPGRYRAGRYWPAQEWSEADVTLEQLAELEADSILDVEYKGKITRVHPPPEKLTSEQYEAKIADLIRRCETAEARVAQVRQEAEQEARQRISLLHLQYERKVAELENDVRALKGDVPYSVFPRPETSDERARE